MAITLHPAVQAQSEKAGKLKPRKRAGVHHTTLSAGKPAALPARTKRTSISRNKLNRYVDRFGATNAVKYLRNGISFEEGIEIELLDANKKLANRTAILEEKEAVAEAREREQAVFNRKAGFGLPIRGKCFRK